MFPYNEHISIELNHPVEEAVPHIHRHAKNIRVAEGDCFEVRRHNSWLHLLAPTGKIEIKVRADGNRTVLDCLLIPSIFTFRSAVGFTILSVLLWSAIFWFFPLNIYMIAVFILHWIMICFVALYLLVGLMTVITIMLLVYNLNDFPLLYIVLAWLVTLLITHLTLMYNRSALKQYLFDLAERIKRAGV